MSLFIIIFLFSVGFISYKITNSYALFSDEVIGIKTIEATVKLSNLDKSGANEPVLDSSMIPVYYDESSSSWRKADIKNHNNKYKWYDYDNKMWANSVTVSETNRSKYQSANLGTEIPMNDILTMEVWIPRYKYKVFNYNSDGTKTSSPQQIEITFEKENKNTSEITCINKVQGSSGDGTSESCKLTETNTICTNNTCNNKTYTHPGFTFGDEEIKGFWIGKFEITGTINNVTCLPNKTPITDETPASFYVKLKALNTTNNIYGFSTNTDTHMIKNMEWGAVGFLSHSKYGTCTKGVCTEVGINAKGTLDSSTDTNRGQTTGCGNTPGTSQTTICNVYNKEGVIASTTGNVYGVYDMSGGVWEYTSATMVSSTASVYTVSPTTTPPPVKYQDYYSYGTTDRDSASRKRGKLGDNSREMTDWYKDANLQVFSLTTYYWVGRSCAFDNGDSAGIFTYHRIPATGWGGGSSRLIITTTN